MSWIKKNYPVGAKITAPCHITGNDFEPATVVNHTTDNINKTAGIIARFDFDNIYTEIDTPYLNENGGGVV